MISLWHKSVGKRRYRYPIGTPIRIEAQAKICHGQAFIEQIRSTLLFMGMLDRAYRTFLHISFSYFHGNSKMIGFWHGRTLYVFTLLPLWYVVFYVLWNVINISADPLSWQGRRSVGKSTSSVLYSLLLAIIWQLSTLPKKWVLSSLLSFLCNMYMQLLEYPTIQNYIFNYWISVWVTQEHEVV